MNTELNLTKSVPTVFVIDDDHSVLESIFESLRTTGLDIECFTSVQDFLVAFDDSRSGCVVTDVKMPGMSGLQLQQALIERNARIPVIVISGQGDIQMVLAAMRKGAMDFLEKPYVPKELRTIILRAIEKDAGQRRTLTRQTQLCDLLDQLTPDERQVVEGITAGKTAKVIAQDLNCSLRTIQFRRASAMRKLHVDRAGLIELVLAARKATY